MGHGTRKNENFRDAAREIKTFDPILPLRVVELTD